MVHSSHLRPEPAGHGGRTGHPPGLRRRGHRRPGPPDGRVVHRSPAAPLVERHEFFHEVRGKGLMIGLEFGAPTSRALRLRWNALEAIRPALFSQTDRRPPLPPPPDPHPGGGGQREHHEAPARRSSPARRRSTTSSRPSTTSSRAAALRARASSSSSAGRWPRTSLRRTRSRPEDRRPRVRGALARRTGSSSPGPAGFIGSAVTRALLARGVPVVALLEPGRRPRQPGRLRRRAGRRSTCATPTGWPAAVKGSRAVFHVAALYRFWARHPQQFYDVNVGGTRNVMAAARAAGTERLVYTSTVGTLGLEAGRRASPSDETVLRRDRPPLRLLQAVEVRGRARGPPGRGRGPAGLPRPPHLPARPGRPGPTPTGQLVLDYLNGRIPGYVDTALNVAHVDDLAAGHLLALERGGVGRSYILGGENYSLEAAPRHPGRGHRPAPLPAPGPPGPGPRRGPALGAGRGHASCTVSPRSPWRRPGCRPPGCPSTTPGPAGELGYSPRPASEALAASARWFVDQGLVVPARRARIELARLTGPTDRIRPTGPTNGDRRRVGPGQHRQLVGADVGSRVSPDDVVR